MLSAFRYTFLCQREERGGIAQLGERLHGMQEVRGSIPLVSTIRISSGFLLRQESRLLLWVVTQCRMQSMRHNKPPAMRVEDKWLYQKHLSG